MRFFLCLTCQELELLGSQAPLSCIPRPHTPIGVVIGEMMPEECDHWRQRVGFLEGCNAAFYGKEGWARVTIEPLNLDPNDERYGKTMQDPQLLILEYKKASNIVLQEFPFKR